MKKLIVLAVLLAGCSKPMVPYDIQQPDGKVIRVEAPPDEPVWGVKLRAEAKELKVNYWVYCYDDAFYGVAWPYGTRDNEYAEDGGIGEWVVRDETQKEATEHLMRVIRAKGTNWEPASHREIINTAKVHNMECPPELGGHAGQQ